MLMLRQEFLKKVGEMGQDENVSCRVSRTGTILVKFKDRSMEMQLLQAVCWYALGVSKDSWTNAYYELRLHSHTAMNVCFASGYPHRGIFDWRRVRDTRKELFLLLGLPFASFYAGKDRIAGRVAAFQ